MSDVRWRVPFLRPRPARLSRLRAELEAIEDAGVYTNHGPVNQADDMTLDDVATVCGAVSDVMRSLA
jgi:hypothetical protein